MWYKKNIRQVRRARRQAKRLQRQLAAMELAGVLALSVHTLADTLTLPITDQEVASQVLDTLREALRTHRVAFKAETRQLQADWRASKNLREKDREILRAVKKAASPSSG